MCLSQKCVFGSLINEGVFFASRRRRRERLLPVEVPVGLYRLLPDAEICLMPNTGHAAQRERLDWFNAIVLDFLARRAA